MADSWTSTLELAVVQKHLYTAHGDYVGYVVTAIKQKYRNTQTGEIEWRDLPELEE